MEKYRKAFRRAFDILEEYHNKDLTSEDWERIAEKMRTNNKFESSLMHIVFDELERIYKSDQ